MDRSRLLDYHQFLARHHNSNLLLLQESTTIQTTPQVQSSLKAITNLISQLFQKIFTVSPSFMRPTSTNHTFTSVNMSSNTNQYAASTFSDAATAYSYDKASEKSIKSKTSLKQKVKSVFKDIGTNPFEYDDEKDKHPASWMNQLPPSRS